MSLENLSKTEADLEKINKELYSSNGDFDPTPLPTESEKDKKIKELEERIRQLELDNAKFGSD